VIRSTLATSGPTDGKEGGYRRPAYPIHTHRPSLWLRKAPIRAGSSRRGGDRSGPCLPLCMLRGPDLKR
jgi:hypothetical protein